MNDWLRKVKMAMEIELREIVLLAQLAEQLPSAAMRKEVIQQIHEEAGEASFWNTVYACFCKCEAHDPNCGPGHPPGHPPGCGPGHFPGFGPGCGCGPGHFPWNFDVQEPKTPDPEAQKPEVQEAELQQPEALAPEAQEPEAQQPENLAPEVEEAKS